MAEVVKSGTAVVFVVEPGVDGYPSAADTVSLALVNEAGETLWQAASDTSWVDAQATGLTVPGEAVVTDQVRAFVLVRMTFKTASVVVKTLNKPLVIEAEVLLQPCVNSLGSRGEIVLASMDMTGIDNYTAATEDEQIRALINAHHNIGAVGVDFRPPARYLYDYYPQNRLHPADWMEWSEFGDVTSTFQLTLELMAKLHPTLKLRLIQAQIVEADDLLGGDPVEKMRRSGLLSHSAGESTHFYRPARPLDMPISKRTAKALKGIISYAIRIAR